MSDLDKVLELMAARASGKATNEEVEAAVQGVLSAASSLPSSTSKEKTKAFESCKPPAPPIEQDTENYDDIDEAEEARKTQASEAKPTTRKKPKKNWWDDPKLSARYAEVPLGLSGARMVTTFGGSLPEEPPLVETVSAVLEGARRMLQVAVQDARQVRRQRQKIYQDAQTMYKYRPKHHKTTLNGLQDSMKEWSPELLYRVQQGHDPLSYKPKCGFDMEDLHHLFPEEMNAYTRWNANYKAYDAKVSKQEEQKTKKDESDPSAILPIPRQKPDVDAGGHLLKRSEQFDLRTDQMGQDWYLGFSEVRKGSFLPRKKKADFLPEDSKASWVNMSPVTIRFLHWVGFEPDSWLPPPKEAVTHALAFLGYDFVGKITEKAIALRSNERDLLELQPGESLTAADIARAMEDSDIKPVPLCGSQNVPGPQLYFGPGFEHRLEMELDILSGNKNQELAPEDAEAMKLEGERFDQLAKRQSSMLADFAAIDQDEDIDEEEAVDQDKTEEVDKSRGNETEEDVLSDSPRLTAIRKKQRTT